MRKFRPGDRSPLLVIGTAALRNLRKRGAGGTDTHGSAGIHTRRGGATTILTGAIMDRAMARIGSRVLVSLIHDGD